MEGMEGDEDMEGEAFRKGGQCGRGGNAWSPDGGLGLNPYGNLWYPTGFEKLWFNAFVHVGRRSKGAPAEGPLPSPSYVLALCPTDLAAIEPDEFYEVYCGHLPTAAQPTPSPTA